MNPSPLKSHCPKLRPGNVSRGVSVCFWLSITSIASVVLVCVWPEPYVFRVSQSTFNAWEEQGGKQLPLDDFKTGYARLEVFEKQRFIATLFCGAVGGALVHLVSSALTGKDTSFPSWFLAFFCAVSAMVFADSKLPPLVDPVYGAGGLFHFPWWAETLIPMIFFAVPIGVFFFLLRWLLGKRWCSKGSGTNSLLTAR